MASAVRCRHPSSCDADLIRSSASVYILRLRSSNHNCPLVSFVVLRSHSSRPASIYPFFVLSFSINRLVHSAKSFEISLISPHSATSAPSPTASPSVGWRFWFSALLARPSFGCGCHFRYHPSMAVYIPRSERVVAFDRVDTPLSAFILVHLTLSSSPSTSNLSVVCLISLVHRKGSGNILLFD